MTRKHRRVFASFTGLILLLGVSIETVEAQGKGGLKREFQALARPFLLEYQGMRAKQRGKSAEEKTAIYHAFEMAKRLDRFWVFADAHRRTPEAVLALKIIARHGVVSVQSHPRILARLEADHLDDLSVRGLLFAQGSTYSGDRYLKLYYEKSSNKTLKGIACWLMVKGLAQKIDSGRGSDEEQGRFDILVSRCRTDLAAVEIKPGLGLKRELDKLNASRSKVAIGALAQEIDGLDLDGKPLKLSDYRGKVVVLLFWGDW